MSWILPSQYKTLHTYFLTMHRAVDFDYILRVTKEKSLGSMPYVYGDIFSNQKEMFIIINNSGMTITAIKGIPGGKREVFHKYTCDVLEFRNMLITDDVFEYTWLGMSLRLASEFESVFPTVPRETK